MAYVDTINTLIEVAREQVPGVALTNAAFAAARVADNFMEFEAQRTAEPVTESWQVAMTAAVNSLCGSNRAIGSEVLGFLVRCATVADSWSPVAEQAWAGLRVDDDDAGDRSATPHVGIDDPGAAYCE